MKNTYSATIKMNSAEQLARFIDEIGPLVESVLITTTPVDKPFHAMAPTPKKVTPPKVRVSKVNDTILATLQNGPASVRELKEALEARHLSAGSLSTGIAALTKSGEVYRESEGVYALAMRQTQAA
jgi:hypothetical protein